MSAIANLIAYDGAATPTSHTLTPVSVTREKNRIVAEYREQLAGVPLDGQVRVAISLDKLKSGVLKTETRVVVPVMEAVTNQNAAGYTAQPKVAYENTVVMTGFFHPRSDLAGRRLVRFLAANILNGQPSSGSPLTTGPVPELMDQMIAPT